MEFFPVNALRQIESANELRQMETGNIRSYKKPTETLMRLYAFVEENPMVSIDRVSKGLGIAYNTAAKNIEILQGLGILEKNNDQLRYLELGVAYSYLYNQYNKRGEDYIFPFALYPIQKGQALSGTPMANIQTGDLNDKKDIHSFLEYLSADKRVDIGAGVNRKLHSFMFDLNQIFLGQQNIVEIEKMGAYFDDSIGFKCREDIVNTSTAENMIVVNYNMNPYERKDAKYPNFISIVLKYVDKLDVCRYLDFNNQAEFRFEVINFTNSLRRIFVEFKYSDSNIILETFEFSVSYGENKLSVPLERMRSKALNSISEICFVIHPDDVVEEEGMFKVGSIGIN